jgi:hypothetical protein
VGGRIGDEQQIEDGPAEHVTVDAGGENGGRVALAAIVERGGHGVGDARGIDRRDAGDRGDGKDGGSWRCGGKLAEPVRTDGDDECGLTLGGDEIVLRESVPNVVGVADEGDGGRSHRWTVGERSEKSPG